MIDIVNTWEYKQFVNFLKKHKRYPLLIKAKNKVKWRRDKGFADFLGGMRLSRWNVVDLIIDFYNILLPGKENHLEKLVSSQLWRFQLLEEIETNEPPLLLFSREDYKIALVYRIKSNGTRGSKEIKELFNKHNIKE
jgi:hypothetical protein